MASMFGPGFESLPGTRSRRDRAAPSSPVSGRPSTVRSRSGRPGATGSTSAAGSARAGDARRPHSFVHVANPPSTERITSYLFIYSHNGEMLTVHDDAGAKIFFWLMHMKLIYSRHSQQFTWPWPWQCHLHPQPAESQCSSQRHERQRTRWGR